MNDPDICVQCGAMHATCCQISPGREESCFPLSLEERRKLERCGVFISGPRFALSSNSKTFLRHLRRLFPQDALALHRLFPLDASHHRLALTPRGHCVFLGATGCMMRMEDRPYYCRLYPFWFIGKRLSGFASSACLAVQCSPSLTGLCSLFNTSESALWDLYTRLRVAWGIDHHVEM